MTNAKAQVSDVNNPARYIGKLPETASKIHSIAEIADNSIRDTNHAFMKALALKLIFYFNYIQMIFGDTLYVLRMLNIRIKENLLFYLLFNFETFFKV